MGMAHSADTALLTVFAAAVAHHREACRLVDAAGPLVRGQKNNLVRNPAHQVARDTAAIITRVAAELGLMPSARSRLSLPGATSQQQDELAARYLS